MSGWQGARLPQQVIKCSVSERLHAVHQLGSLLTWASLFSQLPVVNICCNTQQNGCNTTMAIPIPLASLRAACTLGYASRMQAQCTLAAFEENGLRSAEQTYAGPSQSHDPSAGYVSLQLRDGPDQHAITAKMHVATDSSRILTSPCKCCCCCVKYAIL